MAGIYGSCKSYDCQRSSARFYDDGLREKLDQVTMDDFFHLTRPKIRVRNQNQDPPVYNPISYPKFIIFIEFRFSCGFRTQSKMVVKFCKIGNHDCRYEIVELGTIHGHCLLLDPTDRTYPRDHEITIVIRRNYSG